MHQKDRGPVPIGIDRQEAAVLAIDLIGLQTQGNLLDGLVLEQIGEMQILSDLFFDIGDEPNCQQGVSTQFEKVIPYPHILDAQMLGPDDG